MILLILILIFLLWKYQSSKYKRINDNSYFANYYDRYYVMVVKSDGKDDFDIDIDIDIDFDFDFEEEGLHYPCS